MAGDDLHENLLKYFPGAVTAECEEGWASVTGEDGREGMTRCPACAEMKVRGAITTFIPPRFNRPIPLPAAVTAWTERGTEAQGLYLAGPVGTGKTHTAWMAVTRWCLATGIAPHGPDESWTGIRRTPTVIFTRMTDLLDDLRPGDDGRQRVRDCQNTGLLVLDDLGAEKASEWTQERLYSIVDDRYANCRPLLVTGNLPPGKLEDQTGARTASRLAEMCEVVAMTGADRRKQPV